MSLDTIASFDGLRRPLIDWVLRGCVAPHHSKSYSPCPGVTRQAYFADFEDNGGCRVGVEISRADYLGVRKVMAELRIRSPLPLLE
jgi:hypothetical protein